LDYRLLLVFLVLRDSQDDCCHLYPDTAALLGPAVSLLQSESLEH